MKLFNPEEIISMEIKNENEIIDSINFDLIKI